MFSHGSTVSFQILSGFDAIQQALHAPAIPNSPKNPKAHALESNDMR
jgi:hypothetical protein